MFILQFLKTCWAIISKIVTNPTVLGICAVLGVVFTLLQLYSSNESNNNLSTTPINTNPSQINSGTTLAPTFTLVPTPNSTPTPNATPTPTIYIQSFEIEARTGFTDTMIVVPAGAKVRVVATGLITLGFFVGEAGPEGKSNNFGSSLEEYNIVRSFSHGVLLCKLDQESEWRSCGSFEEFIAPREGILRFLINDNDPSNNVGEFDIEVMVTQ
jgi:hypothetical protein